MAGYLMIGRYFDELRLERGAYLCRIRASSAEAASGGWVDRTWYVTLKHHALATVIYVYIKHGRKQRLRVRMQGVFVDFVSRTALHNLSEIHYCHMVAYALDDCKVVGDKQISKPALFLYFIKQIEYLSVD